MRRTLDDLQDLTSAQHALLARLEREQRFTEHFYFTGDTLLKALGIVPRESNDLDFFTFPEVDGRTYTELLSKRDLLRVTADLFLRDGEANAGIVKEQVQRLLDHTTL